MQSTTVLSFRNPEETVRTTIIRDGTIHQDQIEIRRVFVHPGFKFPSLYDDIAVAELGTYKTPIVYLPLMLTMYPVSIVYLMLVTLFQVVESNTTMTRLDILPLAWAPITTY